MSSSNSSSKMYNIIVFGCLIITATAAIAADESSKQRIIGGKSINIEDAPYQVSVYDAIYQRHLCGGSIISANYILTAAHCANLVPQAYRIRVGSSKRLQDGELINVIAVIKHKEFHMDGAVPLHDIALMKVVPAIDIDGKSTKVVKLARKGEKFTQKNATLSGWGHTADGRASEQLQSLKVKVLSRETCDKKYSHFQGIRDGQICAEHRDQDKDLCNGDSGGPLVVDGKQVGIVSWSGPGCAKPGRPGVYTEVAAYRDWIDKHLQFYN